MYLAVESSGMALLRDSIVPVSTISCKKDPGMMRLVKPRRIMPALPTGCATRQCAALAAEKECTERYQGCWRALCTPD